MLDVIHGFQKLRVDLFLSRGFNVLDVEQMGSFSTMVKFCMNPGVRSPVQVGIGRGVGRGVIDRKPESPTATVLRIYRHM
jgi:hypothetical protein